MYLKSDFADVHFKFPNDAQAEKLPAYKAILATTSSVFTAMFYGPLKKTFVRLADEYDMLECFDTCAAFLEANLTNENMV